MANDPVMQLSLMKHAKKKLGHMKFDEGLGGTRHYYTIKALLVLLVVAALWLWCGSRLLVESKRNRSKSLSS